MAMLLLLSLCTYGQEETEANSEQLTVNCQLNKEVLHSTMIGVGSSNVLDTYLSSYNYKGTDYRIQRETMRMTNLWGGRFSGDMDEIVKYYNASIFFDQKMYNEDIDGSIAHVTMLAEQGIEFVGMGVSGRSLYQPIRQQPGSGKSGFANQCERYGDLRYGDCQASLPVALSGVVPADGHSLLPQLRTKLLRGIRGRELRPQRGVCLSRQYALDAS